MSDKAISSFIDTMIMHFPPYRWEDEQEKTWAATMTRELRGFPGNVLDKAAETMVRTRKDRKIPLVSECIAACLDTKKWLDARDAAGKLPIQDAQASHLDWTAGRLKLATDLVMGLEGRQAAKEGWIGTLWGFARRNARLPSGAEIGVCKRQAKDFDEAYADCVRAASCSKNVGVLDLMSTLERLGAGMLQQRNELADRVLRSA